MSKKTLVVIPYLSKEAQGCELELAVAGWHKHFKEQHQVLVVGDYDRQIEMLGDKISFIECPRVEPVDGQYLPHLDQMNKFIIAHKYFPEYNAFIYSNDDIYAVKDFTLEDVRHRKVTAMEIPFIGEKEKDWWGDMGKSRAYCLQHSWPIMDWACHLPVYIDFRTLFNLTRDMFENGKSYEWQNLYFNYLCRNITDWVQPDIVPEQGGKWKYAVNRSNPGIRTAEDAKAVWITNANCGWSERLEKILREHYGEKL